MAGRSVLELAVGTGQWDAGLKKAQQALNNFTSVQGGFQQAMQKDTDKMQKFIGMMGKMDSTAKTSKGQLNEYRNSFEQLTLAYNRLSDADKRGEIGKTLMATLDSLKGKIQSTKREMDELTASMDGASAKVPSVGKSGGGMFGQLMGGIGGKLGISSGMLTGVGAAVAGFGTAIKLASDNVSTAMGFEKSLSQLSSLTGKTGKELEQLKNYAIELGSSTTLSASQVADAFKMIGSQQPQLLSSGEALRDVTKSAITLSEAAGIDLATAAQSLSTSINQFGGDSTNATRFVNVLAAASQKGAGDISFLGEAISKSGVLANSVGTSYEELVANLEQLAAAGMDASTAGTALRSIIANLEKQSNNEYKPSVVGLTQAFQNMNDAHLTTVDYLELAGKQFFSQAMILAENADKARDLTKEITGTNTAEKQAKTNTDNLDGSLKSLASAWEGLNLHINSSNGLLRIVVDALKDVIVWADQTFTALGRVQKKRAEINASGGDGERSRVDVDIEKLRNNNNKATYGVLLAQYDREIAKREKAIERIQYEHRGKGTVNVSHLEEEVEAWKQTRQEFVSKAQPVLSPKAPVEEPTAPSSVTTTTKKGGKGGGGGGHKITPAERAEQTVDSALQSYAQTITEADLRMEAGLDTSLDHKKKELSAQQRLFEAYGRAYAIYADPKYKEAYDSAAMEYKKLAEEVKNAKDPSIPEGSIKDIGNKIRELQKDRELLTDPIEIAIIDTQIDEAKDKLKELTGEVKKPQPPVTLEYKISQSIADQRMDADMNALANLMKVKIEKGLDNIDIPSDFIQQAIFGEGLDIPDDYWRDLTEQFNKELRKRKDDTIELDYETGNVKSEKKERKDPMEGVKKAMSGITQITGGLEQMGVKVPESINKGIAVMQGLITVIEGVQTIISLFSTGSQTLNTAAVTANTVAVGALTTAMLVNTAVSAIPFLAGGGIAHAASGLLTGHHFSGDNVPVMVNDGELILNRAQQGNIASQLGGGGIGNLNLSAEVSAEKLRFVLNNEGRRTGRGEIATTKRG